MSERSPEDFPSTPITKEAHSGLPGVPDDVAERVDNPNFEFDTPLIQQAKDLQTPEDLGYTAEVRGVKVPVVTPEEQETLAAQVAATHAPEKKKMSLKGRLALIGVGILGIAGIGTAGYNAAAEGPFMKAPTASAPPVPGQGEKTPTANQGEAPLPATPNTGETQKAITPADYKFHDDGGTYESSDDTGPSLSFYDLVDQSRLDPNVVRGGVEVAAFKKAEEAANWFPSEKSVRETLKKPTEQLTAEDFLSVARLHRQTVLKTILKNDGALYNGLDKIGEDTANTIAQSIDDKVRYQVSFTYNARYGQLVVADNSELNSIDDNSARSLGTYQLRTRGSNSDITSSAVIVSADGAKKNTMQLNGAIGFEKAAATPAQ